MLNQNRQRRAMEMVSGSGESAGTLLCFWPGSDELLAMRLGTEAACDAQVGPGARHELGSCEIVGWVKSEMCVSGKAMAHAFDPALHPGPVPAHCTARQLTQQDVGGRSAAPAYRPRLQKCR